MITIVHKLLRQVFNPLIPTAKKKTVILKKSCKQKHSLEDIWRKNIIQNIANNSPSNILKNHS